MIYIVKHKDEDCPIPKGHKVIGVGAMFEGKGENINQLNPYINEATAYYDLWKNSKDKTIGVCHYRRFFAENGNPVDTKRINEILKDNDVIVCMPYRYQSSVYNDLRGELRPYNEDVFYDKYLEKVYKKDPGFKDYMSGKEFWPREMIIAKKQVFDDFCKQLFKVILPIAKEYEKEFKTNPDLSNKNPRIIGFITERYFSYVIAKNNYKVYEMENIDL